MTRSSEAPGLRETILAISGELLNEGGPASLSMREVSRRAGCTHQAPYHHFKSREGILAALITEGFLALEKALSETLRASADATPQETTRAAGHAYLTFALKNPGVFRLTPRAHPGQPSSAFPAPRPRKNCLRERGSTRRSNALGVHPRPRDPRSRRTTRTWGERRNRNTPIRPRVH